MAKQWWQSKDDPVKPWKIGPFKDPCDCSQGLPLAVSGLSEKQGPTHYCPVCRWAFWPIEMKPTAAQINYEKKTNPDAKAENMSYIRMCNKPSVTWGSSSETKMIDQLGGQLPQFLTVQLREYWNRKYCEKYPSTERGKAWAEKQKELKRKGKY